MNATSYAGALLQHLGAAAPCVPDRDAMPAALGWAASGLMQVTGHWHGPPLMCPVPVAACADGALAALAALAPQGDWQALHGAALLGLRARLMGLPRRGTRSPGGACRLLPARDGWLAVSMARPDDWHCVAAWLQREGAAGWGDIEMAVRRGAARPLLARARELGLAAACADDPVKAAPWVVHQDGGAPAAPRVKAPRVVDLSTLWAGPLCGALLARAGAAVAKVESVARPDGARQGHGGFFDVLNGGKASVALDFRAPAGIAALRNLLLGADIVIESARPRALRQLGIVAEECLAARPGLTWVSITGHGRRGPQAAWVGFGDDAAVAGGFAQAMESAHGDMLFCGDALADPLTGLHAAVAAWSCWQQGGGKLVSLSLSGVAAHCVAQAHGADLAAQARAWTAEVARAQPDALPLPRKVAAARALGADTRAWVQPC